MRIAIAGKGGAGKTTISATLARLAARGGASVVAIDADSNPNLATALGIDPEVAAGHVGGLPFSLVSRKRGGAGLTRPVDDVVSEHGILGPDGVRLLLMGAPAHAEEGCMCSAHATVSAVLGDLASSVDNVTIVDMEASPEHLSRGTARHADALLIVTEPYYRSLETAGRLALLADELPFATVGIVVNKVRSAADSEAVADYCQRHGLTRFAEIPWSDDVLDADRARVPLLEAAPAGPAVAAIAALAERLVNEVRSGAALAAASTHLEGDI